MSNSLHTELISATLSPEQIQRQNFIDSLRAVADFYESHPNLPPPVNAWDQGELYRYGCTSPAEFAIWARELDAKFTLMGTDLVRLDRRFGCLTVGYRGRPDNSLVRRKVGTAPVYEWTLAGGAE